MTRRPDVPDLVRCLGQLGHEVGTPLGSLLMMVELLAGADNLTDRQRRFVADMQRAVGDVRGVVQGLVRLARLTTGAVAPEAGNVDVETWIDTLRERLAKRTPSVTLTTDLTDPPPRRLHTDGLWLWDLATSLGAWGAARGPAPHLRIAARIDGSPGLHLVLRVDQAGTGADTTIPWDEPAVLDPLGHGDLVPARRHAGPDFALAIARALAWRLGGTLTGSSEPGADADVEHRIVADVPAELADPMSADPMSVDPVD